MACLVVCVQDLNNCSLERRACSTHSAISSCKMEWDCLFIFRMGYRSVLLTKYHRLPETSWATSSFLFPYQHSEYCSTSSMFSLSTSCTTEVYALCTAEIELREGSRLLWVEAKSKVRLEANCHQLSQPTYFERNCFLKMSCLRLPWFSFVPFSPFGLKKKKKCKVIHSSPENLSFSD